MRKIRELLETEEKLWIYFDSPELCQRFYDEDNFRFGDLPAEKWKTGFVIAVHRDGTMGHLPIFIWCMSFSSDTADCPQRIDYKRFIEGAEDKLCHSSHFKGKMLFGV